MLKNIFRTFQQIDKKLPDILQLDKFVQFIQSNTHLIIFLGMSGVIAYGYDFFSFSLRIDSENHANYYGPQLAWVSQGRWGMYLLNQLLLPDTVMPFIPTLIAVLGCVAGALFFVHSLSEKRGLADYLAGSIAIACPVIYFAMYFTTLGYGVGVAFAVSSLGIYLLGRHTISSAVLSSLCFTLGIGIYQAVLPLIAALFCLKTVASILDSNTAHTKNMNAKTGNQLSIAKLSGNIAIFLLILGVATGLSHVIGIIMMRVTNVAYNSEYLSAFLNYQNTAAYFFETLQKTIDIGWHYYTGHKDYYLFDLRQLKILFVLTFTISLFRLSTTTCSISVKLIGVLLLIAAIAAPLAMLMLNAANMPPRTLLGVSYVLAGLVFFSASTTSNLIRIIIAVLSISCFYNFSMINNRFAFSNQMTWQADRDLSIQLLNKIHDATSKLPEKTDPFAQYPLEIVGWLEYQETPIFVHREVIGASFYTWGAGDPERVSRLFKTMGVMDYRPATKQERLSVIESAQKMPSWPYNGSVDLVNNVVVVKLSNYNPNELAWLCEAPDDINPACLKHFSK